MRLSKRIVSILIIAALSIPMFLPVVASAKGQETPSLSKIDESKYITPKQLLSNYNKGVVALNKRSYSNMSFGNYKVDSKMKTFSLTGKAKRSYAWNDSMTSTISGKLNAEGKITKLTLSIKPSSSSRKSSAAYLESWTLSAKIALQALFDGLSDDEAYGVLAELKMPYATKIGSSGSKKIVLANIGNTGSFTLGGFLTKVSASIDKSGKFTMTIEVLGEAKSDEPIELVANKKTTLKVGEKFSVRLEFTAGTGYEWQYKISGSGASKLLSADTKIPDNGMVGGSAVEEWVFEATKPGTQTFSFAYYRSWEGLQKGDKTVTFEVNITR